MNGSSPTHDPTQPKFHSIMELREAMDAGSLRSYGSPVMTLKETIDNHFCEKGGEEGGGNRGETRAEIHHQTVSSTTDRGYNQHGNGGYNVQVSVGVCFSLEFYKILQ